MNPIMLLTAIAGITATTAMGVFLSVAPTNAYGCKTTTNAAIDFNIHKSKPQQQSIAGC